MKKMIAMLTVGLALVVNAQEFGSAPEPPEGSPAAEAIKELPPKTGTGPAVQEMQQVQTEEVKTAKNAEAAIQEYLNSKDNLQEGIDEDKGRIIVTAVIDFDIKNPKVSADFIELRKEKMSELLIRAKAEIIKLIMSNMSACRILDILPVSSIAEQVEKEQKETTRALKAARDELERLDANLAASLATRDNVTPSELLAVISSWFTKADQVNIAEKLDADKKEAYANAKAAFEEAKAKYNELAEKAETIKGKIASEMKSDMSIVAQMPIYGCTVLQQAESITAKNGRYTYQIAILYSWSQEMMNASSEILKGNTVNFKPGKRSLKEWLFNKSKSGALSQWAGPRQFIDNKGNMWFLGISCAPIYDDADLSMNERDAAGMEAAVEVMYSLYSDAMSSQKLEKLMHTKVGANDERDTKVYKALTQTMAEAFSNVQISGNGKLWSGTVHHEPSDLDMYVVVYGVNSGSVKTLRDIQARAVALGIEVNTYQEMERGRQNMLRKTFDASKNNPAAREAGAAAAAVEIKNKAAEQAAKRTQTVNTFQENNNQSQPKNKGNLRQGTQMIIDDED